MVKPIVSLLARLRSYVVVQMHIGHLHPGDRLPSYRTLADRWDVDHRMIARAYKALEAEGLVEVRGRSGVFLREQERIGGEMLSETALWVASGVLTEAWQRRIRIPDLPKRIRKCIASVELRSACIESSEDHRYLLCNELREWFGFNTDSVSVDLLPQHDTPAGTHVVQLDDLPEGVRAADVLITTMFHAHRIRPIAELLQKPFVAVSMHPMVAEIFLDHLQQGPLAVVCVDPRFGDRLRAIVGPEYENRIQVVLASHRKAVRDLDPGQPILVTAAARAQIGRKLPSIITDFPAFSPASAAELAFLLIRLNLESTAPST